MNCTRDSGWRRPFDARDDRASPAAVTQTSSVVSPKFGAQVFEPSHDCVRRKTRLNERETTTSATQGSAVAYEAVFKRQRQS